MQIIIVLAILILIIIQFVLFIQLTFNKKQHLLKPIGVVFVLIAVLMLIFISAFYW
ncbi:hypothetical protein [Aliicoccus persicus]|uniref:Uncharacterized protein n=1 Tax=Aliicoccus persicus TaxID=930138 RepID=A0A662Z327_9STAP|nr:hypothetical protein [Aliicoccus persicus]SEV82841.1 hypothetical protein SAMN05192557_0288 [Aliicoccus persicus]